MQATNLSKNHIATQVSCERREGQSLPWSAEAQAGSQSLLWMWKLEELSEPCARLAIQSLLWAS